MKGKRPLLKSRHLSLTIECNIYIDAILSLETRCCSNEALVFGEDACFQLAGWK